jgi:hypothetical protein
MKCQHVTAITKEGGNKRKQLLLRISDDLIINAMILDIEEARVRSCNSDLGRESLAIFGF